MKRNALALGVAAALGVVGAAQAQNIQNTTAAPVATSFQFNPQGVGHVLVMPYFSAASGNFTNFNIVNTDSVNGKLLKVRVRSAANSDDLFDFQLFMSPGDVWAAVITTDPVTGKGALRTADKSCTIPSSVMSGSLNPFVTDRINAAGLSADDLKNWTREGYVEVLNMADIPSSGAVYNADLDSSSKAGQLYRTIKHVNGVAPCDPTVLSTANYGSEFSSFSTSTGAKGLFFPSGGLFGNNVLMNATSNVSFSSEMSAIVATNDPVKNSSAYANFAFFPQLSTAPTTNVNYLTSDPLLRTANTAASTTLTPLPSPFVTAASFDFPDLSTPYVGAVGTATAPILSASNLMGSIATTSVSNEFVDNAAYGGTTDWTLSFPLRRYQIAMDYARSTRGNSLFDGRVMTDVTGVTGAKQYFSFSNTSVDSGNKICVASDGQTQTNREEGTITSGFVISPGTSTTLKFCGEASVVKVGTGGVLGAQVAVNSINAAYTEGWMKINTTNGGIGLPVLGRAYMKAVNSQAGAGLTSNYGVSFMHRIVAP